jgi:hypothetical protein
LTEVRKVAGFVHNADILAGLPSYLLRGTQVVLPVVICWHRSDFGFQDAPGFIEQLFLPIYVELFQKENGLMIIAGPGASLLGTIHL